MFIKKQIFRLLLIHVIISFGSFCLAQSLPAKSDVVAKMKLVDDYWINGHSNSGDQDWARATYNVGNMAMYYTQNDQKYLDYAKSWANKWNWTLVGGNTTRIADAQCCGQTYIELYILNSTNSNVTNIKTSIDNMINSAKKDDWWWVDAMFMAMPVFTKLGSLYNDTSYFHKLYDLYSDCKTRLTLYDTTAHLWYRDASYLYPNYKTPQGKKCFWSRGNGWVFAAHVRTLQLLPTSDPHYNEYLATFKEMAAALKDIQRFDGFWNASLYDPQNLPGPETSGTNFFTYGLAWGINNGFLDEATYEPVVAKAWNGLVGIAVHSDGFLGYVQNVGSEPASTTYNTTTDFGVGGFLLAGSEVYKLIMNGESRNISVNISATPLSGFFPLSVNFDGSSSAVTTGSISKMEWNFGDGTTAEGSQVSHTYSVLGIYYARLYVTDSFGNTSSKFVQITVKDPNPPLAPSNLIATAFSASRINLKWTDNSISEEGFYIERKTEIESFKPIDTLGANTTSFSDISLVSSTKYKYRVVAFNAAGVSAYSNEAEATTLDSSSLGCLQSTNLAWLNKPVTTQRGTFTVVFNATPSVDNVNTVIGLSNGSVNAFPSVSAIVRFNPTGAIDAYNSTGYSASNAISFAAGTTYYFRVVINVVQKKYSAYVTPTGGTESIIGIDYSFRSTAIVDSLNNLASFTDVQGNTSLICNFAIVSSTNVESVQSPTEYTLNQNYPNPFNPSTVISYQLPAVSQVQIKVFDLLGREVVTLVNEIQQPGTHEAKLNAQNLSLTSGIYFYTINAGKFLQTKKMMLTK